jgi:hypothetical protein
LTSEGATLVNGLPVPAALVAAIQEGRWPGIVERQTLERVFHSKPVMPRFLSLEDVAAINKHWHEEVDPLYIGEADDADPPGDIDPVQSLVIAELGPDQLIALDYRPAAGPEVVYASDDARSPWRRVAGSIEELLTALGWV